MFGLGVGEIVLVGVMALIFIGPKKLPEVARTIGSFLRDFQHSFQGIQQDVREQMQKEESPSETQPASSEEVNPLKDGEESINLSSGKED